MRLSLLPEVLPWLISPANMVCHCAPEGEQLMSFGPEVGYQLAPGDQYRRARQACDLGEVNSHIEDHDWLPMPMGRRGRAPLVGQGE
jgi:hypothetical protein